MKLLACFLIQFIIAELDILKLIFHYVKKTSHLLLNHKGSTCKFINQAIVNHLSSAMAGQPLCSRPMLEINSKTETTCYTGLIETLLPSRAIIQNIIETFSTYFSWNQEPCNGGEFNSSPNLYMTLNRYNPMTRHASLPIKLEKSNKFITYL